MEREHMSYNQVKMKIMDSKRPIVSSKNEDEKEDFELAIATVKQSINDMNEISQEIDEIQTKFDTLNYQLEKTQGSFVKRIGWLKRNINDLEELI
tara:strand:- start:8103 stop:8387 length:285 start_codon:yes stop_codon:yes gene_type:complete